MTVAVVALAAAGCGKSSTAADSGSDRAVRTPARAASRTTSAARATSPSTTPPTPDSRRPRRSSRSTAGDTEPQDGESNADKVQRLAAARQGRLQPGDRCRLRLRSAVKEVAAKFPKITFGIIDDETVKADNIADLVFHEEQGSFLAGVAAAKATKTDHIGFIGGVDIPLIHKFEAGYEQGARSVNAEDQDRVAVPDRDGRRRAASPARTRARTPRTARSRQAPT